MGPVSVCCMLISVFPLVFDRFVILAIIVLRTESGGCGVFWEAQFPSIHCFRLAGRIVLGGEAGGLFLVGNVCCRCLLRDLHVVFVVGFVLWFLGGVSNADDLGLLVAWFSVLACAKRLGRSLPFSPGCGTPVTLCVGLKTYAGI